MANIKDSKATSMGLHQEALKGRTQQVFFNPEEAENFYYYGAYDVDFNQRTEIRTTGPSIEPTPKYPSDPSKIRFSLFNIPTPKLCLP